jgi:Arc/MetJ-type ribon-helix-helix transcriptional regulator
MKTKTVNIPDELYERMTNCMAAVKVFNASEFIRLALEAGVTRIERKLAADQPPLPVPEEEEPAIPSDELPTLA